MSSKVIALNTLSSGYSQTILDFIGGKASSLLQILNTEANVPDGFVLSSKVFEKFLEANELDLNDRSSTTYPKVLHAKIPDGLFREIYQHCVELGKSSGCRRLIIRSSALGEDGSVASFAGQLESHSCIIDENEVKNAILRCWASFWNDRVLSYQKSRGIRLHGMAIIIQELIEARCSGVLFTESPRQEDVGLPHQRMLIEYVWGPGELLVSGAVTPNALIVDYRNSRQDVQYLHQSRSDEAPFQQLPSVCIEELVKVSLVLEKKFQRPLDIEWVSDEQCQLFIVQARPITTIARKSVPLVHWSNVNLNENYPEPITPLLYSIASVSYYHYFRNVGVALGISSVRLKEMESSLRTIVGAHGARLYYNLTSIYRCLRILPGGSVFVSYWNSFVGFYGSIEERSGGGVDQNFSPLRNFFEITRILFCFLGLMISLPWRVSRFEKTVDNYSDVVGLLSKSDSPNAIHFSGFLTIRFEKWIDATLCDAAAMLSYGILGTIIRGTVPKDEVSGLMNSLLAGSQEVVSSQPAQKLWELGQMARATQDLRNLLNGDVRQAWQCLEQTPRDAEAQFEFKKKLDAYLKDWGYRFSGELLLTVPNYRERPHELLSLLKNYLEADQLPPEERIRRASAERKKRLRALRLQLWRKILTRPVKSLWCLLILPVVLPLTHIAISYRERARLKQAKLYGCFRSILLSIGEKLASTDFLCTAEDVFFLTYPEILSFLDGTVMLPETFPKLVAERKAQHALCTKNTPPETFSMPAGSFWTPSQTQEQEQTASFSVGKFLKGASACGGRVSGAARVLRGLENAGELREGDILIATQTDPGWAPVFCLIKGLVMERGGMLSHGAIIAREFGIPAIVGVPNATAILTSGQKIDLDADRGTIEI